MPLFSRDIRVGSLCSETEDVLLLILWSICLNYFISILTYFNHCPGLPHSTRWHSYPWNYFSHIITSSGLGCAFLWGWNTSGLLVSLLATPELGIKILFHTCLQSLVNVNWCYGRHRGKIWAKPRSQPSRSSQCSGRGQIAEELEKGAMAGKEMLLTGSSAWLEVVKAWRSETLNWAAVGIGWGAPWHAMEWRD